MNKDRLEIEVMMDEKTADRRSRKERWEDEAAFFDAAARRVEEADLRIDPLTFQRYSGPSLRRRFSMEFRHKLLGSLEGRRLLDVGCGDGLNAVMFAKMGASVTGLDVSRGALDAARRRAGANGVADRVEFICSPIETAKLPQASFDVVWGDGVLHHVLEDLEAVMRQLVFWVKPEGLLLFSEPVNLFDPLRRLRRRIPIRTEATSGERPLVRSELELVRRYIPGIRMRHYTLLGRLDRFILVNFNYEKSPAIRRMVVNGIDLVDYALLSLPLVRNLAGTCVMYGHLGKRHPEAPSDANPPGEGGRTPARGHRGSTTKFSFGSQRCL